MLLTGTFVRSVDDKLRVAIPKAFRDALPDHESKGLFVTPGTDGSLAIYAADGLAELAVRLAAASPTGQDVRAFSRLFYARAERVDTDRQGRVRLPAHLAELASLGKEVVLLGVRDHIELWNKEAWDKYLAQRAPQFDQIAESAFTGPT